MVKQCIFCGQPLPRDDARFCNGCGRTQIAQPNVAASATAIKVKLPPREFSRAEPPAPMADTFRPLPQDKVDQRSVADTFRPLPQDKVDQRSVADTFRPTVQDKADQGPSRLPKRPVRLTSPDASSQQETLGNEDRSPADAPRASSSSRQDVSAEASSTMVVPGWQEELAQLRKERSPSAPREQAQPLSPPPVAPEPAQKGPIPLPDPDKTPRRGLDEAIPVKLPPDYKSRQSEAARRELHVRAWEQEPTTHLPQPSLESSANGSAGPAPAIEQTPFVGVDFEAENEVDQIAAFDTVLWPAAVKPQGSDEPTKRESGVSGRRVDRLTEEEEEELGGGVDNLPTVPLVVPEVAKPEPKITIERASTPAPRKLPVAPPEEEDVEDLPTRPIASTFAGPRTPTPAAPPQQQQSQERFANPNQQSPGPRQPVPNPISQPGGPGPFAQPAGPAPAGFIPTGPGGRVPNPGSQPGIGFNPGGMPAGPQNPPSQPGIAPQHPGMQGPPPGGPGSPQSRPTTPPNTPRPDPAAVEAALKRPRQRKRTARTLVVVLIILLLAGGGIFFWQYNTPSLVNQPYQSYQNAALGFSVSYTQGWNVNANQTQGVVHFVDSSHTGQVSLSDVAVNNQTLAQYVSQETTQFGIIAPKTEPVATFAGASWQQVKGSVVQTGATYNIVLYITEHGNHFYTLACLAPAVSYSAMEQNDFSHLRSTFQFL